MKKLIELKSLIEKAVDFETAWNQVRGQIRDLFQAEEIRLYRIIGKKSELVSDGGPNNDLKIIKHKLATNSLAGFTALTKMPVLIRNVEDKRELRTYHQSLEYDPSYDEVSGIKARSIISVPLRHESALFGVLQIVNKLGAHFFTRQDEATAKIITGFLSRKIHLEFKIPAGPYESLVQQGLIAQEDLEQAKVLAKNQGKWVSQVLRKDYNLEPDVIGRSLERYYQVPFMRYARQHKPPKSLLAGINIEYLKTNLWLPVTKKAEHVVILTADPNHLDIMGDIQQSMFGSSYEIRVGLAEEVLAFLGDTTHLPKGEDYSAVDFEQEELDDEVSDDEHAEAIEEEEYSPGDLLSAFEMSANDTEEESVQVSPLDMGREEDISQESRKLAVRYVNNVIMYAYQIGATDIHIEPSQTGQPAMVRMRVDGVCKRVLSIPEAVLRGVISRIKILSGLNIAEKRIPQDGKAQVNFKGKKLELRIATLPTVNGEGAVLRLLASGKQLPFEKLNLSAWNTKQILQILEKPHGIFLVVGPTGSGKTTTLHAVIHKLNTPEKKIWTVEDPVEITQPGLQQIQTEANIGLDFAKVMRAFLRADPDIILIGEMRDRETAQISVEASLTGHLVFSTLHTNSAAETIARLLDMGIDPVNFGDALLGVVAQRLVRTLCPKCKEGYRPGEDEVSHLVSVYGEEFVDELPLNSTTLKFYRAKGCESCQGSGYKGRTGIHELLVSSSQIRQLIFQKQSAEVIRDQGIQEGMRTLFQDGIYKIVQGHIDYAQLSKVASMDS